MQKESIRVSAVFPVSPARLYEAWLDGEQHGKMTGEPAEAKPRVGTKHSAWNGYIKGITKALEPAKRIVQTWYAGDFPDGSDDSLLEIILEAEGTGTRVTLVHTQIPKGLGKQYEQGWDDFYFTPMRSYFASEAGDGGKSASRAGKAITKPAAKTMNKTSTKNTTATQTAQKTAAKRAPAAKAAKKPAAKKPAARKPARG